MPSHAVSRPPDVDDDAEPSTVDAQYTAGVKGPPMTAQQAWAAAAEGEARQAQIMGSMASKSADIYRSTIEQMAR